MQVNVFLTSITHAKAKAVLTICHFVSYYALCGRKCTISVHACMMSLCAMSTAKIDDNAQIVHEII